MAAGVRFEVLGPLRVTAGGQPLDVGGPRQRAVLAFLLTRARRIVPVDHLIDAVWDGRPPDTARRQIQNNVSALRRVFASTALPEQFIVADEGSYRLHLDGATLDADLFAELVHSAERRAATGREAEAAALLRDALGLWRGPALLGLTGRAFEAAAASLTDRRLSAAERLFDLELALGRHHRVIAELSDLVAAHPLRERLVGQLMRALHRGGRQADALAVFRRLRAQLAEDLGVRPGADVQRVHRAVLAGEDRHVAPRTGPAAGGDGSAGAAEVAGSRPVPKVIPAQLPADVAGFAGRDEQLRRLDAIVDGRTGTGVVIASISGTGGVGKTALAVHWAHHVRERFPDGQLFVNLGGHGPDAPMPAVRALAHLIQSLGVPAEAVPADPQSAAGLYRSLLDGRSVLVVLDNAADLDQLVPLLPGAPTCPVVVTSRDALGGLAAAFGARLLTLDVVSDEEARAILHHRLGTERVAAEPTAVARILDRCAGLPLALAVVAARAAAHPAFPLSALADELAATRDGLDAFDGGAPAADVRAVFSWSYRRLSPFGKRLFRLLGLHPGPDFDAPAALSLAGIKARDRSAAALAELARAHLISEYRPGRYQLHDLLRAYAAELTRQEDPAEVRKAAVERILDHYLHSAYNAGAAMDPRRKPLTADVPAEGTTPAEFDSPQRGHGWFTTERAVLFAAAGLAVDHGEDARAWRLAWALGPFLDRAGHWAESVPLFESALAAAVRTGERPGIGNLHSIVAMAMSRVGRHPEAERHHEEALRILAAHGDRAMEAIALINSAGAYQVQGRFAEALQRVEAAQRAFRAIGDRRGLGFSLTALAYLCTRLGDHERALRCCAEALEFGPEIGEQYTSAVWSNRSGAEFRLGRYAEAARSGREALRIVRGQGHAPYEAEILDQLGDIHAAAGERDAATAAWKEALEIVERLPDGDGGAALREKLAG